MPFEIIRANLAEVNAEALVVPANEYLIIDGGTGLAVARAAGLWRVRRACKKIGYCACGHAVHTPAFKLRAKYLIHTVGPVWTNSDDDPDLLRSAYRSALSRAIELECSSVAVPLLCAGARGCPSEVSLALALEVIHKFLETDELDIKLVLYNRSALIAGISEYPDLARYLDETLDAGSARERRSAQLQAPSGTYHTLGRFGTRREKWADELSENRDQRMGARPQMWDDDGLEEVAFGEEDAWSLDQTGRFEAIGQAADEASPIEEDSDWAISADACMPGDVGYSRAAAVPAAAPASAPSKVGASPSYGMPSHAALEGSLEERLASLDAGFRDTLFALIDERGLKDSEVYKRANLTRQHFAKIRKNAEYRPTKPTVFALAIALELDLDATVELLARAGYALSHASKFDVILEYYISHGIFDSFAINQALYAFDQQLLG